MNFGLNSDGDDCMNRYCGKANIKPTIVEIKIYILFSLKNKNKHKNTETVIKKTARFNKKERPRTSPIARLINKELFLFLYVFRTKNIRKKKKCIR